MSKPWFDADTGLLLFDEYVLDMPSFKRITADAAVTDAEMEDQSNRVVSLLRELEGKLPADVRDLATEAFCELAVLNALYRKSFDLP